MRKKVSLTKIHFEEPHFIRIHTLVLYPKNEKRIHTLSKEDITLLGIRIPTQVIPMDSFTTSATPNT